MTVTISGYHAHVYYDADSKETAEAVLDEVEQNFPAATRGRMHDTPVGPHPMFSCQIAFSPELFGSIIPWLATNRRGLIVFIHTETGDHIPDHTDFAMWMGGMPELNLDALR